MRFLRDVECQVRPIISFEGHPATEILHTWTENGVRRHACSRVWWVIDDTIHGRASVNEAFKKRNAA